jgi:CspA family cold shock protein
MAQSRSPDRKPESIAAGPRREAEAADGARHGHEHASGGSSGDSFAPGEGAKDLSVHHRAIAGDGLKSLAEGAKVSYEAEAGPEGPSAANDTTLQR